MKIVTKSDNYCQWQSTLETFNFHWICWHVDIFSEKRLFLIEDTWASIVLLAGVCRGL